MDTTLLCGWSALQAYRTPPSVRAINALLESDGDPSSRLFGGIDYPLHAAVEADGHRKRSRLIQSRVFSDALPASAFELLDDGVLATIPLYTLLTLAPALSPQRLALVASELAGNFALFQPTKEQQAMLSMIRAGICPHPDLEPEMPNLLYNGWKQAYGLDGKPTALWQRAPLISRDELATFLGACRGAYGIDKLKAAERLMVEGAASPLEVQTAILLCSPRRLGGEGLGAALCNKRIDLSPEASRIAHQKLCYCDLFLEGGNGETLDIECHSRTWHDDDDKAMSDQARALALELMGIKVIHLAASQLYDDEQAAFVAQHARKILGVRLRPPSTALLEKRQALRAEVLTDCMTLGLPKPPRND